MNIAAAVKELSKTLGEPRPRATFGTWPNYAWLVRGLVEKGHRISDAVKHVLEKSGLPVTKQSFGSLRAAYYKIRDAEWPAKASNKAARKIEPEETGFE